MKNMKKLIPAMMGLIVAQLVFSAHAESSWWADFGKDKVLNWQFSPYTHHYTYDSEHRPVVMFGLERAHPDGALDGAALFTNSFGQPTVYVYPWGGVYHPFDGLPRLSLKWTAGLLYGYRQPYEEKVPLNFKGLSPAVIPAVGYDFASGWSAQVNILGTAGLMFQLNAPFN